MLANSSALVLPINVALCTMYRSVAKLRKPATMYTELVRVVGFSNLVVSAIIPYVVPLRMLHSKGQGERGR